MMKFFRKNMQTIFLITIIGFLAGIFIGFGGYFFGNRGGGDSIAEINGTKIPYSRYVSLFNRTMDRLREDSKVEVNDQLINQKKQEVVQDLIQEEVFSQEAKKYGIVVGDQEVAYDIQRLGAFQRDGRFDQQLYFQMLYTRLKMSPQTFEESERKRIEMAKLRELVVSGVKITDRELEQEYAFKHRSNMSGFAKDKDKFLNDLFHQKVNDTLQEWYKVLGSSIKIKVHSELLK